MVSVPPEVSVDGSGSAVAAAATMSIDVRRSGSPPLSATRSVASSSSRRQRPNSTTSPGWRTTVPTSTEPPIDVPFVLPRSCTDSRPPTALRRKCRRDSWGSPRSRPSQSRPTSSGRRTTTCSGARPGSVIVTVVCIVVTAIPDPLTRPAGRAPRAPACRCRSGPGHPRWCCTPCGRTGTQCRQGACRSDLAPLEEVAHARLKPTPLAAAGRQAGPFNDRWNILVNADIESDL